MRTSAEGEITWWGLLVAFFLFSSPLEFIHPTGVYGALAVCHVLFQRPSYLCMRFTISSPDKRANSTKWLMERS